MNVLKDVGNGVGGSREWSLLFMILGFQNLHEYLADGGFVVLMIYDPNWEMYGVYYSL